MDELPEEILKAVKKNGVNYKKKAHVVNLKRQKRVKTVTVIDAVPICGCVVSVD